MMTDDRSTTDIDIARLRELHEKATKAPWSVCRLESCDGQKTWVYGTVLGNMPRIATFEFALDTGQDSEQFYVNAQLAAEVRNALPSLLDAIAARDAEIERLTKERDETKHEAECLQARIAEIDYPCSPHCDGYLREFKTRRQNAALAEALRNLLPNYLAWKETGCGVTRIDVRLDDLRAARAALSALDAPTQAQPNASVALAEAVEIMRPFEAAAHAIFEEGYSDEELVTTIAFTAGDFRAARAFIKRHSGAKPAQAQGVSAIEQAALDAAAYGVGLVHTDNSGNVTRLSPEDVYAPSPVSGVSEEEVDEAYRVIGKHSNPLAANADIKQSVRAALETFLANRGKK